MICNRALKDFFATDGGRRTSIMNLTLNPELSRLIPEEVDSGRFTTAEAVIAAGVTRVLAESDLSEEELADLKIDVGVGVAQADRGEFVEFKAKDIAADGRAILARKAKQRNG
jgi:antitoxin ParD1/3/4